MMKAIMFDLDDTLIWDKKSIKKAFEATCALATDKYEIDANIFEEKVRDVARTLYASYDTYEFTKKIGINPFEGLWGTFPDSGAGFGKLKEIVPEYRREAWTKALRELRIDDPEFGAILAETFPKERKKHPYLYAETFRVLDQLKGHYQLLLLTNGSPDLQATKLELTPALKPYFDHIVVSGAFGKGKPDITIFEYALDLLSVKADEVLMVGDNLMTDILGASKLDIKSVWINHNGVEQDQVKPTYEIADLGGLMPIIEALK